MTKKQPQQTLVISPEQKPEVVPSLHPRTTSGKYTKTIPSTRHIGVGRKTYGGSK